MYPKLYLYIGLFIVAMILIPFSTYAQTDLKTENPFSIHGYEKRTGDRTEAFLVSNNTNQTITRIRLLMTYTNYAGQMLDSREVTLDGDIAPANSRKFEIGSFDQRGRYTYYKNAADLSAPDYLFKVQFSTIRYEIAIY